MVTKQFQSGRKLGLQSDCEELKWRSRVPTVPWVPRLQSDCEELKFHLDVRTIPCAHASIGL